MDICCKIFDIWKTTILDFMVVFFLRIPCSSSIQHLFNSWHAVLSLVIWKPSSSREHCNSLQKRLLVSSRLLCWYGEERLFCKFKRLFRLGVKEVGDFGVY